MENSINERLRKLIKNEKITQKKFCDLVEISENTLKNTFQRNSNPGTELLVRIAVKFPEYSLDWLLTGEGEMQKAGNAAGKNQLISSGESMSILNKIKGTNIKNVGGNQLSSGITEIEKLTIENETLRTRIEDMERIISIQKNTIDAMQLTINTIMNNKNP
ncbi:MAG: helix-turn-helix domain containing protein [Candidatus Azobacteroides sp.]|nr:helix-turn-helix domain containing protein [Candidatus Azobacteroides sp.]